MEFNIEQVAASNGILAPIEPQKARMPHSAVDIRPKA
jgi:hypothetical protein